MPDEPRCGLPHYDWPETVCTEPAGHYRPDLDPHAGPLIIGGRHCGGAAWDEPTPPPEPPMPDTTTTRPCTWPTCLTEEQHAELAAQVTAEERGEHRPPMPDQRPVCGCGEAPEVDAELDRRLRAALAAPLPNRVPEQTAAPDPLTVITGALHDHAGSAPDIQARHVYAALQGLYVPPPPGSDRDALPEHLRPLISLNMAPYLSTGCQAGNACLLTAREHPEHAGELLAWAGREHASCRSTRKQDMAQCRCACHGTGRPIAPAVDTPADAFGGTVAVGGGGAA